MDLTKLDEQDSHLLIARILDVSFLGELKIAFSQFIDISLLKDFNQKLIINEKLLDIYIKPNQYNNLNSSFFDLTWQVKSLEKNILII